MIFTPRRAAWLICSLALLLLAVACEIENDLPPRATSVAIAPEATSSPTEAPAPGETATPPSAPTQEPTATPETTSEPTPHPEPTVAPTPAPEPTATPEPESTPAPEPTSEPTPHPEPTPAPYSTPAPEDQFAMTGAPAPAGSTVVTDDGVALTITSLIPDAESVLANENPDYYEPPHEDYRRFIARLRVQNVGGDADNPIPVGIAIFNFYLIGSDSEPLGYGGCGLPIPNNIEAYEDAILFPGGTLEGNICFEVPKSETDLILVYDTFEDYNNQIFFALAAPDSVEPVRVVDAPLESQAAGRSRFNPVAPGRYVESADGLMAFAIVSADMDADISVIPESRYHSRGDPYYYPPAEGNRLVAARVRVQNIGGDVDSVLAADGGQFAIVGSSGIESYHYYRGCRATLDPPELFLGGIAEINVCFEVPESETDLVLNHASVEEWEERMGYYSPHPDGGPRRWLAFGNPDTVEAPRVAASPPEPSPAGQATGRSRSAAAPFGASAYNRFGMAVSIVSADLDATDEILKYNPSNGPPAEGNRFVMARARVDWVGGNASDHANIGGYSFGMAGSSAVVFSYYDNSCGAISDALPLLELSGGEAGEIDVCFELPESETDLILFHGFLHDESARWLRMPEN